MVCVLQGPRSSDMTFLAFLLLDSPVGVLWKFNATTGRTMFPFYPSYRLVCVGELFLPGSVVVCWLCWLLLALLFFCRIVRVISLDGPVRMYWFARDCGCC